MPPAPSIGGAGSTNIYERGHEGPLFFQVNLHFAREKILAGRGYMVTSVCRKKQKNFLRAPIIPIIFRDEIKWAFYLVFWLLLSEFA